MMANVCSYSGIKRLLGADGGAALAGAIADEHPAVPAPGGMLLARYAAPHMTGCQKTRLRFSGLMAETAHFQRAHAL